MYMDVAALIIAILALLVSVIVPIIEDRRERKINKINLESEFYKEIYKEHLIKLIPNARKYIGFTESGQLRDTEELREELNKLRQDSLYFLYSDKNYYNKLKRLTQELEDYLITSEENTYNLVERKDVLKEIQRRITELYTHISNNYLGDI